VPTSTPRASRKASPAAARTTSTDAIVVLKKDHKEVAGLFAEFEKKTTTKARRGAIVAKVLRLLAVHTHIENTIMYPEVVKALPEVKDDVLESYEEHHVVDVLSSELAGMTPDDERFVAKFTVLMENVRHHVREEEDEWFPIVRKGMSRTQLREMGARMVAAKKTAPEGPTPPSALKKVIDAVVS
jgi:hemerythrin superfamily protein